MSEALYLRKVRYNLLLRLHWRMAVDHAWLRIILLRILDNLLRLINLLLKVLRLLSVCTLDSRLPAVHRLATDRLAPCGQFQADDE